jgi:hypothetical protein
LQFQDAQWIGTCTNKTVVTKNKKKSGKGDPKHEKEKSIAFTVILP